MAGCVKQWRLNATATQSLRCVVLANEVSQAKKSKANKRDQYRRVMAVCADLVWPVMNDERERERS